MFDSPPTCVCDPISVNGYPYSPFFGSTLHDCVYSPADYISVILGFISLLLYIPAIFPQIIENYRRSRVDALAPWFIFSWLIGDFSNLIGCIETQQLQTQLITSLYFEFTDVLLMSQFIYYGGWKKLWNQIFHKGKGNTISEGGNGKSNGNGQIISGDHYKLVDEYEEEDSMIINPEGKNGPISTYQSALSSNINEINQNKSSGKRLYGHLMGPLSVILVMGIFFLMQNYQYSNDNIYAQTMYIPSTSHSSPSSSSFPSRILLTLSPSSFPDISPLSPSSSLSSPSSPSSLPPCQYRPPLSPTQYFIGSFLAWVSGILYFQARIPQIVKNYRRQSVEGLSMYLFCCTITANLTYGLSILFRMPTVDSNFWYTVFPYLFGSLGTIFFDAFILAQSYYYTGSVFPKGGKTHESIKEKEEEEGEEDGDDGIE